MNSVTRPILAQSVCVGVARKQGAVGHPGLSVPALMESESLKVGQELAEHSLREARLGRHKMRLLTL